MTPDRPDDTPRAAVVLGVCLYVVALGLIGWAACWMGVATR